MGTSAIFPTAARGAGMYESFYLRAVSPERAARRLDPLHRPQATRAPPRGSVWCTVFDASAAGPYHAQADDRAAARARRGLDRDRRGRAWAPAEQRAPAARRAGRCASPRASPSCATWPPSWLYRAPLPRTKLTSPAPGRAASTGSLELPGRAAIELRGWPGMVGHNWGSEHAERWIWLHGIGFEDAPEAWLDVALGRMQAGGRMTPWVANGALSLDGRRHRVGGLGARGLHVAESAAGCPLLLTGARGLTIDATRARSRPAALPAGATPTRTAASTTWSTARSPRLS